MDDIVLRENEIDVETYLGLRRAVDWKRLTVGQAQAALDASLFTLCAYAVDGQTGRAQPIGMGRIVGDGAVICYVQDLIVVPEYRHEGVGHMLLDRLTEYVESITADGTEMMFDLMCAIGREEFYKQHGFIARPTDTLGPGMIQYIDKRKAD